MSEITIKVHRRWNDEEVLVKRIARVVYYDDEGVAQQNAGYKWCLNSTANDWWASGVENGEIRVAYRYGTQELMSAMKVVLEWVLN